MYQQFLDFALNHKVNKEILKLDKEAKLIARMSRFQIESELELRQGNDYSGEKLINLASKIKDLVDNKERKVRFNLQSKLSEMFYDDELYCLLIKTITLDEYNLDELNNLWITLPHESQRSLAAIINIHLEKALGEFPKEVMEFTKKLINLKDQNIQATFAIECSTRFYAKLKEIASKHQ